MSEASSSDPFASTADPRRYVPREATERVLERLEACVRGASHPVALTGPAGLGKTLLLHVLEQRVGDAFRVVRVPYPALSAPEICTWVLDALGAPRAEDPEGMLLDQAFRGAAAGREILLLVDDASALPPKTARSLATLVSASGGALRAVFAAVDDARLGAALAALGPDLEEIRLEDAMSEAETEAYLEARLADVPALAGWRERLDEPTRRRLHVASAGVPRRLHHLVSIVHRASDAAAVPGLVDRWLAEEEGRDPRAREPDPELETGSEAAASQETAGGAPATGEPASGGEGADDLPSLHPDAEPAAPSETPAPVPRPGPEGPSQEPVPEPPGVAPPTEPPRVPPTGRGIPMPELRDPSGDGPGRWRGGWVAVLALIALALLAPYALSRLDTLWPPVVDGADESQATSPADGPEAAEPAPPRALPGPAGTTAPPAVPPDVAPVMPPDPEGLAGEGAAAPAEPGPGPIESASGSRPEAEPAPELATAEVEPVAPEPEPPTAGAEPAPELATAESEPAPEPEPGTAESEPAPEPEPEPAIAEAEAAPVAPDPEPVAAQPATAASQSEPAVAEAGEAGLPSVGAAPERGSSARELVADPPPALSAAPRSAAHGIVLLQAGATPEAIADFLQATIPERWPASMLSAADYERLAVAVMEARAAQATLGAMPDIPATAARRAALRETVERADAEFEALLGVTLREFAERVER